MKALIIMHHPDEGPGTIGDFLAAGQVAMTTVRLYEGQALPEAPGDFNAIICMGGPMNVYEEDKYPWLAAEDQFLRRALAAGVPLLGVCLGAQLLAKALDAEVTRNHVPELGWAPVRLTPQAAGDRLMAGLDPSFGAFHWHGDTFAIPDGATHLAASDDCAHQAFGRGNAWGLQFHVEVTPEIVESWAEPRHDPAALLAGFQGPGQEMARQAKRMYDNFMAVMRQHAAHGKES